MGEQTRGWATSLPAGVDAVALAVASALTELVGVFDSTLRFVAVNAELVEVLGTTEDALLGSLVTDVVAPWDQERMLLLFELSDLDGVAPGFAAYDLLLADGSTLAVEVAGSEIEVDGHKYFSVTGRPTYMLDTNRRVIDGLMSGLDLDAVVSALLDLFGWREAANRVAIAWIDGDQMRAVSTDLPDTLTGVAVDALTPADLPEPWAGAFTSGVAVRGVVEDLLAPDALADARSLGLQSLWVEPVRTNGSEVDAVLTVWGGPAGFSPDIHAFAVGEVKRYLPLALRWQEQAKGLEAAANLDALTGLANRRVFFERLAAQDVDEQGAVLFADVNDFKAVNDCWGHAAGDAVLEQLAKRIVDAVRDGDLVARIGGDEFGVVLLGVTPAEADEIADRVRDAAEAPFEIGGVVSTVGISVGVAHDPRELSEATLEAADRAQYLDKRSRRG